MRLHGKVALVTGAGSGNGAAIAQGFAREGATVAFADLNFENAEKVAQDARVSGYQAIAIHLDVSDGKSVKRCVNNLLDEYGKIDILVNNAGINSRPHFLDLSEEQWDEVMAVNAKGVFLCSLEVAKHMVQTKCGSIINISSISSFVAMPNNVHYGASKGAVNMMTKHMALDLAPYNIRVNAIAPGVIVTEMNRVRLSDPEQMNGAMQRVIQSRVGSPDDLVGAAILLASEKESGYMTGSTITIDGGWTVR